MLLGSRRPPLGSSSIAVGLPRRGRSLAALLWVVTASTVVGDCPAHVGVAFWGAAPAGAGRGAAIPVGWEAFRRALGGLAGAGGVATGSGPSSDTPSRSTPSKSAVPWRPRHGP